MGNSRKAVPDTLVRTSLKARAGSTLAVIVEEIALMLSVIGHDLKRDEPLAFAWDQPRRDPDRDQASAPWLGIERRGIAAWIETV